MEDKGIEKALKIRLGAERLPASFVAYDCLQTWDRVLLEGRLTYAGMKKV